MILYVFALAGNYQQFMKRNNESVMMDFALDENSLWEWVREWCRGLQGVTVRGYAARCHYLCVRYGYRYTPYL